MVGQRTCCASKGIFLAGLSVGSYRQIERQGLRGRQAAAVSGPAPARCRTRPCDSPGATPPSVNFLVCEPHKTAEAPRPRRRGDRVGQLLSGVAVHEFAHGTSTTLGEV